MTYKEDRLNLAPLRIPVEMAIMLGKSVVPKLRLRVLLAGEHLRRWVSSVLSLLKLSWLER